MVEKNVLIKDPKFGIKYIFLIFHICGIGQFNKPSGILYKCYQVYITLLYVTLCVLHVITASYYMDDLGKTTLNLIVIISHFGTLIKFTILRQNKSRIENIYTQFTRMYFDFAKNSTEEKRRHFHLIQRSFRNFSIIFIITSIFANVSWTLSFITETLNEKDRQVARIEIENFDWAFPVTVWSPVPIRSKILFSILFLMYSQSIFFMLFIILATDFTIVLLFKYLTGHFHILGVELENSGKLSNDEMRKSLKNSIQYHNKIYSLCSEFEQIFGLPFLLYCMVFIAVVSLSGYLVLTIDLFDFTFKKVFSYFIFAIIQLYGVTSGGQSLFDEMNRISFCSYSSVWFDASLSNRIFIFMTILRAQHSVPIKASMFFDITKETFASLVNTAFSYVTVLRKMEMA